MRTSLVFRIYLWVSLLVIVLIVVFWGMLYAGGFGRIPGKNDLIDIQHEEASLILDEDGKLIGKIFSENRSNVSYDSLPAHLVNALVATEDARFFQHDGLDRRSLLRVIFKTILLQDKSSGGGSTLSQQLAKNLYGRQDYAFMGIVINKLKEIILSRRIEKLYSKEQILELYFNTLPFGENVYGIEAAANRYFNRSTADLLVDQAAILVGMLKANSYYNPRLHPDHARERRNVVLSQMEKNGYLSARETDSLRETDVRLQYTNLALDQFGLYFSGMVEKEAKKIIQRLNVDYDLETDGLIIRTTLNSRLQQSAQNSMIMHMGKMQDLLRKQYERGKWKQSLMHLVSKTARQKKIDLSQDKLKKRSLFSWDDPVEIKKNTLQDSLMHILTQLHAGIIGMNPENGAIKAWVGGINFRFYPYDQVLAKRQMASTIKPIFFATAFEDGYDPCDYISNEPIQLSDFNNWSPKNYDGDSGGKYSMAAALAHSMNIPALHLFLEVPQKKLNEVWDKLGFSDPLHQDPSAIYGTNSVSLLELATAYCAFANTGQIPQPYAIVSIETRQGEVIYKNPYRTPERVLSETAVKKLNEILIKAINEGTGASLRYEYKVQSEWAGKTGTSQNYADAWFVTYNSELVLASRVGASFPVIHFAGGNYGSGSALALPLVANTLGQLKNESWYNAGLSHSNMINCEDFSEVKGMERVFDFFRKDETTLQEAKERAKRKKKRKDFFRKIFGGDE